MNELNMLTLSPAPHVANKSNSTQRIMLHVVISLVPAMLAAIYFFGYMVFVNLLCCTAFCAGLEFLYSKFVSKKPNKENTMLDLSCVVTGVILALNLPATVNIFGNNNSPLAVVILSTIAADFIGSAVAIIMVKMLFGGIGRNFVNPAMFGRVFLLLCFAAAVGSVSNAQTFGSSVVTGATWLSTPESGKVTWSLILDMLVGNTSSAAVGETCALAILIGFAYLSFKKIIDYRTPLMVIGSFAVFAFLIAGVAQGVKGEDLLLNTLAHILSGGILFAAVFMATDYATSPNTFLGIAIYATGIGLITVLIRTYGSYPEGTSFALLIMNITVPLIDKYVLPRQFAYKVLAGEKKLKKQADKKRREEQIALGKSSEVK